MKLYYLSLVVLVSLYACSAKEVTAPPCEPVCEKDCGDDGCGGSCGECDDGLACTNDSCGAKGCVNATQAMFCLISKACVPSGTDNPLDPCSSCAPAESQTGWSAVEAGTACGLEKICYKGQCCNAGANCEGKECGADSCGGNCGECGQFEYCKKGRCIEDVCEPECQGKDCGEDGCGDICGVCADSHPDNWECQEDQCVCVPICESQGLDCGDDGCDGKCGQCQGINVVCEEGLCACAGDACGEMCCGTNQICTDAVQCCTPECEGKNCGPDQCGSLCGVCADENVICHEGQCACQGFWCGDTCCLPEEVCLGDDTCCLPQCDAKDCGDDGCQGVCGNCPEGGICIEGKCPPPGKQCNDGNFISWDGCTEYLLTEYIVNNDSDQWQIEPRAVQLSGGGFLLLWFDKKAIGTGHEIRGQRFTADGWEEGSEFVVNDAGEDIDEFFAVSPSDDGGFVVAWQNFGEDTSGTGIFAQRFYANAGKNGPKMAVNAFTISDQIDPSVASLPEGRTVITWSGAGNADWGSVYARIFDVDGLPEGDDFLVNTTQVAEQHHPAVATLDGGGFVIAWQSAGQDTSGYGVYAKVYDAQGAVVLDEFLVNTSYFQDDQQGPVIATLPGGSFVVIWESMGQDGGGLGVAGQVFDAEGQEVGTEFLVNYWGAENQEAPTLSVFEDGQFVVAWHSKNQDGDGDGVYARVFNPDGTAFGDETLLPTYTISNQQTPAVAALSSGHFVAAWASWNQAGPEFGYDIFAARFNKAAQMVYH
jgi:hypothetical protein